MMIETGWLLLLFPGVVLAAPGGWGATLLRVLSGAVLGTLAGLYVTAGIVVGRARLENHYLESLTDMRDPRLLTVPALLIVGAVAGWTGRRYLAGFAGGVVGGAAVGALVGVSLGALISLEPMDRWAGGTLGGALGIVLGLGSGLLWAQKRRASSGSSAPPPRGRAAVQTSMLLLCTWSLSGCAEEQPPLPEVPPAPAEGEAVESVVYLLGDPGRARFAHYPVLPRLAQDVEQWSARLEADSSVIVLVLGDMIYPDGMHDPGTEGFRTDSIRLQSQINVVRGPQAQEHGARMYFLAGNHDWGLLEDRAGTRRLLNMSRFIDRARARGPDVELVPQAGTGGPYVVDVGQTLRLLLLDTAWWLFDAEPERKAAVVQGIERALATAGDRSVMFAAHHPFETAGPHGDYRPLWQTLGIRELLARSGALLQDIESRPYAELLRALERVFGEHGRPLVFAGGHDHSLQVIRHDSTGTPHYSLVSGSASKLSGVGYVDGLLSGVSAPGYLRLLFRENGAVDVYSEAAPERFLVCPDDETAEIPWERCMEQGLAAYGTVFSMRLREPAGARPIPAPLQNSNETEDP